MKDKAVKIILSPYLNYFFNVCHRLAFNIVLCTIMSVGAYDSGATSEC